MSFDKNPHMISSFGGVTSNTYLKSFQDDAGGKPASHFDAASKAMSS
jgi:hypothetical protein